MKQILIEINLKNINKWKFTTNQTICNSIKIVNQESLKHFLQKIKIQNEE